MEEQPVINCRDLYEDTLYKRLEKEIYVTSFSSFFDKDYTISFS
jgi:hypothetical protein